MSQHFPIHPAACLGPMSQVIVEELAVSMKENGYIKEFPLKLYRGKVADGRHRAEAAKLADVIPTTKAISLPKGMTLDKWVLEAAHLRDITDVQKQCYVVKMNPKKNSAGLATMLRLKISSGGHNNLILSLQELLAKRPELFELVETGEMVKAEAMREAGVNYGKSTYGIQKNKIQRLLDQLDRRDAEVDMLKKENRRLNAELAVWTGESEETCEWCAERFAHGPWCNIINEHVQEIEALEGD